MRYLLLFLIVIPLFAASIHAEPKKQKPREWSLEQTIRSSLDYSPALKSRDEETKIAEEGVVQARAGHLPKVNLEASTGGSTLPVAKYE